MRFRSLVVVSLLLLGLAVFAAPGGRTIAADPPTCLDPVTLQEVTATKWLDAPGTLTGTAKRDVLVGSIGSDIIKGGAGNDLICSQAWDGPLGGNDTVDGGAGSDRIHGNGHLLGGSGDDVLFAQPVAPGSVVDGGSGNDDVSGFDTKTLLGGSGNDLVYNDGGNPKIDCGSGTDQVLINGATDVRRCEGTNAP